MTAFAHLDIVGGRRAGAEGVSAGMCKAVREGMPHGKPQRTRATKATHIPREVARGRASKGIQAAAVPLAEQRWRQGKERLGWTGKVPWPPNFALSRQLMHSPATERDACTGVIKRIIATEPFPRSSDGVDGVFDPAGAPTTVSSQTGGAYATRRPALSLWII